MNTDPNIKVRGDGYILFHRKKRRYGRGNWISPYWSCYTRFGGVNFMYSTRSPHLSSAHQFAALLIAEIKRQAAKGNTIVIRGGIRVLLINPNKRKETTNEKHHQ
jgi:hypothetical protein